MNGEKLKNLLNRGLDEGTYSCYAAAAGDKNGIFFREFGGARMLVPERREMTENTLFDMASLSKLIGTTMAALKLIEGGRLSLEGRIGDYFENCHARKT